MGKICSCSYLSNEQNGEFYGFDKNNKEQNEYCYIIKKQFHNYDEKDRKYYGKTAEYDNLMENTIIQDNQGENEPKEYANGSVKIIHL